MIEIFSHCKNHNLCQAQKRRLENNAEDSDDEDAQRKKLALMREHVEQKMAVLQGRRMDWDTELEAVSSYRHSCIIWYTRTCIMAFIVIIG